MIQENDSVERVMDDKEETSMMEDGTMMEKSPALITVTYSQSGFSPSKVTVKKGETVKFVNQSSSGMWVGSAMHPTHAVYDGTTLEEHCAIGATASFDSCKDIKNGESYSFTFGQIGSWNYHNHSGSNHYGTVVVE